MSKIQNKNTGEIGERLVEAMLEKEGYKIVDRNWGNKWGEIDLICEDKGVLVFVEVKTKMGEEFGSPEEMVGRKKLEQIRRMAEIYCAATSSAYKPGFGGLKRIDVVAVVLDYQGGVKRINHYEAVTG